MVNSCILLFIYVRHSNLFDAFPPGMVEGKRLVQSFIYFNCDKKNAYSLQKYTYMFVHMSEFCLEIKYPFQHPVQCFSTKKKIKKPDFKRRIL